MKLLSKAKCFGGYVSFHEHDSTVTKTPMKFTVYLPPQAEKGKVPVLYWLSGLTCTEENFTIKAGAQRVASELGLALICCDTSPRGAGIPGESDSYDFGVGAGFYVNATQEPWSKNYRMYDYVVKELKALVEAEFPVRPEATGIFGHSMGGHGALVIGLRNPELYRSISAFAPITNPSAVPWGTKAFERYLGPDVEEWKKYDACEQMKIAKVKRPILVDQGSEDKFARPHLMPERLVDAAKEAHFPLELRIQPGYDHSYYFVSTFMEEHLRFHAKLLA